MKYVLIILLCASTGFSAEKNLDKSFHQFSVACTKNPKKYYDYLKQLDDEIYAFTKNKQESVLEKYLFDNSITGQTITHLGAYVFSPENENAVPARTCWKDFDDHFNALKKKSYRSAQESFERWNVCQYSAFREAMPEVIKTVMSCYKNSTRHVDSVPSSEKVKTKSKN